LATLGPQDEACAPEPISSEHELSGFDSGQPSLDSWLKDRALRSEGLSARTYVVHSARIVVAYYSLASGTVMRAGAPKRMARNMPDPMPVLLLARLAVDRRRQGQGLGGGLLRDAMARTLSIAAGVGVRGLLVHAIDEAAVRFYRRFGFEPSPVEERALMLGIETIRAAAIVR
jgi:GNAT superfamily N-acetyltransferase